MTHRRWIRVGCLFLLFWLGTTIGLHGQDALSVLSAAKGQRCDLYLKSGEIKKGRLKAVGEDYITVEVKLSPFYAEPQTYRLTQVSKVDLGGQVVDVEAWVARARQEKLTAQALSVTASRPSEPEQPKSSVQAPREEARSPQTSTPSPAAAPSSDSGTDETVRRLMVILKDLDEGPSGSQPTPTSQKVVQASRKLELAPSATVPTTRSESPAETSPSRATVQPSSFPERKELPEVTRQVEPRQARPSAPTERRPEMEAIPPAQQVPEVPAPRPIVPSPKPPRSHLSSAPEQEAMAQPRAPEPQAEQEDRLASVPSQERRPEQLGAQTAANAAKSVQAGQETEIRALVDRFYKAAMVLAGAVLALAAGVVVLTVTVIRRKGVVPESATLPIPSEKEPEPAAPPEPPLRLVMVKGDYAVVDQGLDHGVGVGDLLLVKRQGEQGEYELGLARVLKVFDRLSGIKMVEKFVEAELRVGDAAYRYRPAQPEIAGMAIQEVRRVENLEATGSAKAGGTSLPVAQTRSVADGEEEDRYPPFRNRWRYR
jgi:hypothetical protein